MHPLDIECPESTCRAKPGDRCFDLRSDGDDRTRLRARRIHVERRRAARGTPAPAAHAERKPCDAWVRNTVGTLVLMAPDGKRQLADVTWVHRDGDDPWFWEALDDHGRETSEIAAQLAAEDALLSSASQITATLRPGPR